MTLPTEEPTENQRMGKFEKGNKIGNRFSSENQPANTGRKPKLYTTIKKMIGTDFGHELTESDYKDIMQGILEMPVDKMQALVRSKEKDASGRYKPNPDTPVWVQLLISHINNSIRNGKSDALDFVLNRVFGKKDQRDINVTVNSFEKLMGSLPDDPSELDREETSEDE